MSTLLELTPDLKGWEIKDERLEKTFIFEDFARVALFFNRMINPIEELQNYPKLTIAFNRLLVSIQTPEAGRVMPRDLDLARQIEALKTK